MELLIFPLLIAAMYFLTIRPQQQRLRRARALVASIQVGDDVVTVGGLIGRITVIADHEVRLDIGNGTEVRVARNAVTARLAPGETSP
jgi:preprotein translocase subunit YajC